MFRVFAIALTLLVAAAWLVQPAPAAVLYSQGFESLGAGASVDNLAGWSHRWDTAVGVNSAELGKALESAHGVNAFTIADLDLENPAVNAVPTVGHGLWSYNVDVYAYTASASSAPAEVSTAFTGDPGAHRWANLEYQGGATWNYRFFDSDSNQTVSGSINDGAGSVNHLAHVGLFLDMTTSQMYYKINGVESTHAAFNPATLPGLTAVSTLWYGDCNGLVDNIHIDAAVPEPGTITLLGFCLAGLLAYAWRKRR